MLVQVASTRYVGHAFAMSLPRAPWWKMIVPMSRRDRARLAKLDGMRSDLTAIADMTRNLSISQDAHAHSIRKTVRERRDVKARRPDVDPIQSVVMAHAAETVAQSKRLAESLDRVTEALERMAASLRDG